MNGIAPPSSRLSAAQDRLAEAIARLEAAFDKAPSDQDAPQDAAQDDGMLAQLQALQDENAELRGLVDSTVERLDGTIAKFKDKLAG